jgi:hypothetical protein
MTTKSYELMLGPLETWLNEDQEVKGYQVIMEGMGAYDSDQILYLRDFVNVEVEEGRDFPFDRLQDEHWNPVALIRFENAKGSWSSFSIYYEPDRTDGCCWVVNNVSAGSKNAVPTKEVETFPLFMQAWEEFADLVSLEPDQARIMKRIYKAQTTAVKPTKIKTVKKPECFGAFS